MARRLFKRKNQEPEESDLEEAVEADEEGNILKQPTAPLAAIRARCLDCTCGSVNRIRNCEITECGIHDFRMGKNPHRTRVLTDEQRAAAGERLKKAREARSKK